MMQEVEVTLEQMLLAREDRAATHRRLLETYSLPLISFTVNIPGPRKSTSTSRQIFQEGYQSLIHRLTMNRISPVYQETYDLATGSEAFIVVDADERTVKELVISLENLHPLGRLLDMDVIGRNGTIVSREELSHPKRKCLLCEQDAHACGRSRAHSITELLHAIHKIADDYFQKEAAHARTPEFVLLTI
ncbi:citrate lyase holo-[acyl-carrier protein] synthase [Paenibacillus thiaminolyticus]|uniref:citrate lyase holo-[acyl-carrier protein] synthase n=1 Tax=Paenibacillus thiaminolyticus TaxID=49283 RepID=UPI002543B270|nr:citrate lyase holo-[acyl-carrier protein] synthase [Paenibacillus thiaminolyticus]WII38058.1 citrate lyase holo-[acyl-carrier protein] synthase [Paenibacillus thiaminolyticus]